MLRRLAHWCFDRWILVVAAWLVAAAAFLAAGGVFGGEMANSGSLPGTESQAALDLMKDEFPEKAGDATMVVLKADEGIDSPAVREDVEAFLARVAKLDAVVRVDSPYDNPYQVSSDKTIAFATFDLDGGELDFPEPKAMADKLREAAEPLEKAGVQVEWNSFLFFGSPDFGSEGIGLAVALVILVIAFGSLVAAGLPIITAVIGLAIGAAGVQLWAALVTTPDFSVQLASMIGLGVGIDYALFIVSRYRELFDGRWADVELAELSAIAVGASAQPVMVGGGAGSPAASEPGASPALDSTTRREMKHSMRRDAVGDAMATSGRAVVFAGVVVVISMLGMLLIGLSFLHGVALSASTAVAVAILAAITLLPALIRMAGDGINFLSVHSRHRDPGRENGWHRWSRFVQRHPWGSLAAGLLVLLVLSIPTLSLRLGMSDNGNLPEEETNRRSYDLLAEGFGPGFSGPILMAIDARDAGLDSAKFDAELAKMRAAFAATEGVQFVTPAQFSEGGDVAVMQIFATTAPQDVATEKLVHHLRGDVVPPLERQSGTEVMASGFVGFGIDFADVMGQRLPLFMGAVLALSFVLLMIVFRSILVPLKAVLLNLLSLAAAFGIIVAIFQWGWLGDLVGIGRPGPIEAWAPMMLFAIVFGLSMDYEVFLLSRVREEYDRSGSNSVGVVEGLAGTARVITAAASIMVCVFALFVLTGLRAVMLMGLGLALAVLIDATIVRMLLVPATMELLGERNWWLPKFLDKRLPHIGIE